MVLKVSLAAAELHLNRHLVHTVNSGHELDGVCHLDTSSAVFEQNKEPLSPAKLNQHMHQQPSTAFDFLLHGPNFDNLLAQVYCMYTV